MILSAQRVQSASGEEAVHCTHLRQELAAVESPADRFYRPGILTWQHRPLAQPGNRVRSFVDIAAPEDLSADELLQAITTLVALEAPPQTFAANGSRVAFQLDMEANLRQNWRKEVLYLIHQLLEVHP